MSLNLIKILCRLIIADEHRKCSCYQFIYLPAKIRRPAKHWYDAVVKPLNQLFINPIMKKVFALLALLTFGTGSLIVHAQNAQPAAKASTRMTKSGAPDKRYKANEKKQDYASSPEAVPAGPKKKDGSLDMRYKANKGSNKTIVKPKGK